MKFVCSTKPLADALGLGVINSNISKFFQKSCVAQLTASGDTLKINLEASRIVSEIQLRGSSDSPGMFRVFVDCLVLKQLVATLTYPTTTLEFTDDGLRILSGKSKFTLAKLFESDDVELAAPDKAHASAAVHLDKTGWKFVKDHQMYAIALSFVRPVYCNAWVGTDGDVIVGDFDASLFTRHNVSSAFGTPCLLSDTVINLLNSVPDGGVVKRVSNNSGDSFIISVATDSYSFDAQFTPQYEDDETIGSYNADIILDMLNDGDPDDAISVNPETIKKYLNQAELLSTSNDSEIDLIVSGETLRLQDSNVDCEIDIKNPGNISYGLTFKTSMLKSVIASYTSETVKVYPIVQATEVIGINVKDDNLTTVFAGLA